MIRDYPREPFLKVLIFSQSTFQLIGRDSEIITLCMFYKWVAILVCHNLSTLNLMNIETRTVYHDSICSEKIIC